MIDCAEIERCRRKWLFMAVVFPAFWFIHPLVLASGLAVWLWLGVLWLYMADKLPKRLDRWTCRSDRNLRITIAVAGGLTGFFVSGFILFSVYFLFREVLLPPGWLP